MISFVLILAMLGLKPHYAVVGGLHGQPEVCLVTTAANGDLWANDCVPVKAWTAEGLTIPPHAVG